MKNRIIETRLVKWMELQDLQPENIKLPYNHKHLKESILKHGFSMPFFGWENEGQILIIDGHSRKQILTELISEGIKVPESLPVCLIDAKDRQDAITILLEVFNERQNPIAEEILTEWIELEDVEVNIEALNIAPIDVDIPEVLDAKEDDYEIPDEIKTDIVLGDLFEIGEHRLLCGDSTDSDAVARLMNGQKADIGFTSPPYNAGKTATEAKMGKESKYANDNDNKTHSEYLDLLKGFTANSLMNTVYTFVNVQSIAGNKTVLIDYLYDFKEVYADTLIWQKQSAQPAMAKNVLNSQFEYVHCFSDKANRAIGVKQFRGTLSNVIQIGKQSSNEVKTHNATFPMAFAAYFVDNFSLQSVLDLFLGSGTTMVASHQLNRKCYGMELDPKYCQVIIDRMLKLDPTIEIKRNGVKYEC